MAFLILLFYAAPIIYSLYLLVSDSKGKTSIIVSYSTLYIFFIIGVFFAALKSGGLGHAGHNPNSGFSSADFIVLVSLAFPVITIKVLNKHSSKNY